MFYFGFFAPQGIYSKYKKIETQDNMRVVVDYCQLVEHLKILQQLHAMQVK